MKRELLERTIKQLTWVLENDNCMLKWGIGQTEDYIDDEMINHYSYIVEERTDILKQLSKQLKKLDKN
jgi:recombinational DNA repair ATPase RecF